MGKAVMAERDPVSARDLFFEKGRDPTGRVPEVIARSWRRCHRTIDITERLRPQAVDGRVLAERREARARLRRIAGPELDALAELVADSDSVVLLADADGLILDAVGSLEFLRKAERVALQPGVCWSESGRGTNAIGTALVERLPVEVRGREHYLNCNGILSCAAAPIVSPRGELYGVLDVSGDSRSMYGHALGMVRMAIQIIEHRLALEVGAPQSLLRFHAQDDLLGTHREGVLILDGERIVGANRAATRLLGSSWQEMLDSSVEEWLELPHTAHSGERSVLRSRDGCALHGELARRRTVQITSAPLARITEPDCTQDPAVSPLLEQSTRVLDADIAVLVLGETGVGKEVFARQLHTASRRSKGPFVAVNCAALPESLIESELFGYEDGAFTGARRKGMPGRVREADGGVLFLDEIGDMPLSLQARLLRVLQEREVTPLGGGRPVPVDFALICATVCDLEQMVNEGAFRPDLFYRIQDFSITLPPLRQRPERVAIIKRLLAELGGGERRLAFHESALRAMLAFDWPGNLRQLTSVLRTLVVLTPPGTVIGADRLPVGIRNPGARRPAERVEEPADLRSHNRQVIEETLAACNGCVSEAARRLGIHRSTIYRQLSTERR